MVDQVSGLLADTWWYGLTQRITSNEFESLAQLRVRQGFSAVQIVVGIPPEVGPENPNASSYQGFPWSIDGRINHDYLMYARNRIAFLNSIGLVVVVYGAWGYQIDWVGVERMAEWWTHLVATLDDLDVIYCLSGEINLWVGESSKLLPNKSTGDFKTRTLQTVVSKILDRKIKNLLLDGSRLWNLKKIQKRRNDWDKVLGTLSKITQKPILVHPTVSETGFESVLRPYLLCANTAQTGHDYASRQKLWQLPISILSKYNNVKYINLEPWYEGINDSFGMKDQLFAYWTSMLSGAVSHCYGAQGIWNVGDGKFLSHWGKQTFADAKELETPRLMGLSHQMLMSWREECGQARSIVKSHGESCMSIEARSEDKFIAYFPDVSAANCIPDGNIWLPLEGSLSDSLPSQGPVVVFT